MRTPFLFLAAVSVFAQDGAKIFQQSCAVGYCHGSGGSANRAPRLAGRNFERGFLTRVVENGVPNTAMPGFRGKMPDGDLAAVIAYVAALSGGGAGAAGPAAASFTSTTAAAMPAEVKAGKDAFFNPVRGTRCGTCHTVEGLGSAVGPNIAALAPTAEAIAGIRSTHVQTAVTGDGDRFPALVVDKKGDWVKVFDLTSAPPVLRTLSASGVTFSAGNWRHGDALQEYGRQELTAIAAYLGWLAPR